MKAYLLVAVFLLVMPVHAALTNWNVDISINDDGSSDWAAVLTYNETTYRSDYFIFSPVTHIEITGDGLAASCNITQDVGTSIVCDGISAKEVVYKFHAQSINIVDNIQNLKIFHYPFTVSRFVDKMQVVVKFPLGAALVDEQKLNQTGLKSFEPNFGREGSDGRRIFVSWTFDRPTLGQTVNISAIYELVGFDPFLLFIVILILIIIAFILALIFIFKKQTVKDLLPVLNDGERRVMQILLREKGDVDQRVIVKETDFSKPKVSRIINDLSDRGLIDKVSRGRKNIIKLKKHVKKPDFKSDNKKEEKDSNKA